MQKLAEICIRRPVFATMLIMSLVVVGGVSYFLLGTERFPNIDYPIVTVTVENRGASPAEIETEITDKVEAAVNTISGVKEIRSTSVEGMSQVSVEFQLSKSGDVGAQEVRDKLNLVIPDLPKTIETPTVQRFEVSATPVLQVVVSSALPLREVTEIARKQVKEKLETVKGVGRVQLIGGSRREIQAIVDPNRLQAYALAPAEVVEALRRHNIEIPGGRLPQGTRELTLRTPGKIVEPADFQNVPIAQRGNFVVRFSDIGTIRDASEEQRTLSKLNGKPAVTLLVTKRSGENTVAVAEGLRERIAEIGPTLPAGTMLEIVGDQSVFIKSAVDAVKSHLIEGSILACLVVFVFLWRLGLTAIAAVAIPTSLIGSFGAMAALGYTLDIVTLLALTLMVGVVIDDAIVVLENIERYISEKGYSPFEAASEATREIGLAVLATTLSLLAVFVPVAFMGGIVGRFLAPFGLTSASAIAISMLVSFTLTPMLCARILKKKSAAETHTAKESKFYRPIDAAYTWLLHWSMRHRWAVVGICLLTIAAIVPLFDMIGKDFVPAEDESQYEVSLRAPEGTTPAATETVTDRIAADIRQFAGVVTTLTVVGDEDQGTANTAKIYVKLVPDSERDITQTQLMVRTRELLRSYPPEWRTGVALANPFSGGGFKNATIQYVLTGPDLDKLAGYAETVMAEMRKIPDATDVDSSLVLGKPEVRATIDRARAGVLGVSVEDVAQTLNILVAGANATLFNTGTDQYNVRVKVADEFRADSDQLRLFAVPSSKGGTVPLSNLVKFEERRGPSVIERLNRRRQVTLLANVKPGGSTSEVTAKVEELVTALKLDPGYSRVLSGDAKDMAETGFYFAIAFFLTFAFMYMVLAAQFESFIHPVTIMLTLPLSVPFAFLSLIVAGQSINLFTGLGLLVLFGIVKKNAILQIDHTNGLRAHGLERYEAIIQANRDRLRPILMTTLAFVAGMVPLVVSGGPGAAANRSIGVLVMGGQSLCLLLTLLAVPVFYSLFDDLATSAVWRWAGLNLRLARRAVRQRMIGGAARPLGVAVLVAFASLGVSAQTVVLPESGPTFPATWRRTFGKIPGVVYPKDIPQDAVPVQTPVDSQGAEMSPERAVELAIRNNLTPLLARERREEARGRLWQSLAALLPNVSGEAMRTNQSVNFAGQGFPIDSLGIRPIVAFDTFDARFRLTQKLLDLGALYRYQAGVSEQRIAELQSGLAGQQIASAALLAYLTVLRDKQAVAAAEANVEQARSLLRLAQNQREAGFATALDVVRAGTRLSDEEVRLAQAQSRFDQARFALLRVTGLPLDGNVALTGELRYVPETISDAQAAITEAVESRLETRIAFEETRRAEKESKAAGADFAPSIEAFADYGLNGVRPDRLSLPTRGYGIRITVPIFDGGATYGRRVEVLSRERQAKLQLADTRRQVEQDVRVALKTLDAAGRQVTAAEQSLSLAQRELELARERFSVGVGDNIEVTNAQTALANARSARIEALFQYASARINLAAARGTIETFRW